MFVRRNVVGKSVVVAEGCDANSGDAVLVVLVAFDAEKLSL
ncbi:hypothetical protein [Halorussus pelagicus]|nr:hypothetical protein [Halorussus pelagicus]